MNFEVGIKESLFKIIRNDLSFGVGKVKFLNILNPLVNLNNFTKKLYLQFFSGILPAFEIKFKLKIIK